MNTCTVQPSSSPIATTPPPDASSYGSPTLPAARSPGESHHPQIIVTPTTVTNLVSNPISPPSTALQGLPEPGEPSLKNLNNLVQGMTPSLENPVTPGILGQSPAAPKPLGKSWSSFFNTPELYTLEYSPPSLLGNMLALPKGTSLDGEARWENTLVGFFLEKRLPPHLVIERVTAAWNKLGLLRISTAKDGFYFFKFSSKEDCDSVLKKGPWIFAKQALFLKNWSRDFDFNRSKFTTVPTWVKIYNIPSVYWSKRGIGAIASFLGKPLYTDTLTEQASRLQFARVCIEFSLHSNFPTSFMVQTEFGESFEVQIEYGRLPKKCSACGVFGHNNLGCPNRGVPATRWTPVKNKDHTSKEPSHSNHIAVPSVIEPPVKKPTPTPTTNQFSLLAEPIEDPQTIEVESLPAPDEHDSTRVSLVNHVPTPTLLDKSPSTSEESQDSSNPPSETPAISSEQFPLPSDTSSTPAPPKGKRGSKKQGSKSAPMAKTRNQKKLERLDLHGLPHPTQTP